MHYWSYIKSSLTGEEQVGPMPEADFVSAIRNKNVKPTTKVASPTRTKNQWCIAKDIPSVVKIFAAIEEEQARARETRQAEKQSIRQARVVEDERKAEMREGQRNKRIYDNAFWVATNFKNHLKFSGWATQIMGALGIPFALLILFSAPTVMQEILGVLVGGFSLLVIIGGAMLTALGAIGSKIGAAEFLNQHRS